MKARYQTTSISVPVGKKKNFCISSIEASSSSVISFPHIASHLIFLHQRKIRKRNPKHNLKPCRSKRKRRKHQTPRSPRKKKGKEKKKREEETEKKKPHTPSLNLLSTSPCTTPLCTSSYPGGASLGASHPSLRTLSTVPTLPPLSSYRGKSSKCTFL